MTPDSQGRMSSTPMAPPALDGIGMIELLECDSRPTFILDLKRTQIPHDPRLHTVFSNASLQRLPHILDSAQSEGDVPADDRGLEQYSQFKEWALSSATNDHIDDAYTPPFDYHRLSWTSSTLRKRWRIISGSAVGLKDISAGSFLCPPAGSQKEGQGMSTASRVARTKEEKGKLRARVNPTWVDHLPTSEHVQFFKGTDWSATALGPLETWSDCLRQMTYLLMSDSRAACMFWYKRSIK